MAEDQNYFGAEWNNRLNRLLTRVLGWQQLGTSNIDVYCETIHKKVGLDSVFAYRLSPRAPQQVVIVEAKTREKMQSVTYSEVQNWVWDLLKKMDCVSTSRDFMAKFAPANDAEFGIGLIAVWVRDTETFNTETIRQMLTRIEVTPRRVPQRVFVLDNARINRLCSLYDEYLRMKVSDEFDEAKFYVPSNSSDMISDGSALPMEFVFSDWAFMSTRRRQPLKGKTDREVNIYPSLACFYFGRVSNREELDFIDLAIRDLGNGANDDIDVYLTHPLDEIRSQIDDFRRSARFSVNFHYLPLTADLPHWLDRDE